MTSDSCVSINIAIPKTDDAWIFSNTTEKHVLYVVFGHESWKEYWEKQKKSSERHV